MNVDVQIHVPFMTSLYVIQIEIDCSCVIFININISNLSKYIPFMILDFIILSILVVWQHVIYILSWTIQESMTAFISLYLSAQIIYNFEINWFYYLSMSHINNSTSFPLPITEWSYTTNNPTIDGM